MTSLVFHATATWTRDITANLFALATKVDLFFPFEIDRTFRIGHSRRVFINVCVFCCLLRRYVNFERPRLDISTIGTNFSHNANDVSSLGAQRNCASLIVHLSPVNWMTMPLKPNEERYTVPAQNKVTNGMLNQCFSKVGQHLGQIIPAFLS